MYEPYADLIRRGEEAADALDEEFKGTHPFGTVEAEVMRELVQAVKAMRDYV